MGIPKGATHKFIASNNTYYLMASGDLGVLICPEGSSWSVWYSRSTMSQVMQHSSFDIRPISLEDLMEDFIAKEEEAERKRIKQEERRLRAEAKAALLAEYKEANLKKSNPYYKNPRSKW